MILLKIKLVQQLIFVSKEERENEFKWCVSKYGLVGGGVFLPYDVAER